MCFWSTWSLWQLKIFVGFSSHIYHIILHQRANLTITDLLTKDHQKFSHSYIRFPSPPPKKKSFRNQINESRFHFSSLCIELLQAASLIAMAKLWIKYGAWSNWEESPRYFIYFYFYFLSFLVSLLNLSCWKYFQKIYLCNHLQIWGS